VQVTSKLKVLIVVHNHARVSPGGAELHALEQYVAMHQSDEFEPLLLARSGRPASPAHRYHDRTPLAAVNDDPGQYLFFTEPEEYDWFYGSCRNKELLTTFFRDFLLVHRPDIIHFHHTVRLGYETLRVAKNTLPGVPIVYTLHEFVPICHRSGHMVRTVAEELCDESSPRRCHECFPEITPQRFFLRERFIRSHLALVDLFISPSRLVLERYVAWGIPREKIRLLDHGRPPTDSPTQDDRKRRDRFGFFGQITPFKGVQVLLEAMQLLGDDFGGHLWIHGSGLQNQPEAFKEQISRLLRATSSTVTFAGAYTPEDRSRLMADVDWIVVPSVWWENSPLVLQEAFLASRPVICSGTGALAEKVADDANGLHFTRADPGSLARVLKRAAGSDDLWKRLRKGIPTVTTMAEHVRALGDIYAGLVARADSDPSTATSGALPW
jgi:glycosyltransferase involved in cell wall biosynthesis